jgi:hypothetical protein
MRRAAALAATIASLLVLVPAARAESWELVGPQWAQVNECAGTTAGVRASQPGDALGRPMSTRFSYEWQNVAGAWLPVPGAGSPWLDAGPGPWLNRETGWTQTFASGAGTRVRGIVQMRWTSGAGSRTLVTGSCMLR